jgi:hypothetical protein
VSTEDAPPAWKLWAGGTLVLVLALIATPSEVDNGDICPRPAGWLIVHPLSDARARDELDLHRACNDAAPKRGIAGGIVAIIGGAITMRSRRRDPTIGPT